jgi:hypothetical protein
MAKLEPPASGLIDESVPLAGAPAFARQPIKRARLHIRPCSRCDTFAVIE